MESVHKGVVETPVNAALNGLADKSPIHEPEVNFAAKVNVPASVFVELDAMFEPEAVRSEIVSNADFNASANASASPATTNLP